MSEHCARVGIIVVKITEGEVKSSNRRPTEGTLNQYDFLEIYWKLGGVIRGHRVLREAMDAFDGRNNGVVSTGGDGSPEAPSSRSNEESEAASSIGDGW